MSPVRSVTYLSGRSQAYASTQVLGLAVPADTFGNSTAGSSSVYVQGDYTFVSLVPALGIPDMNITVAAQFPR
ncbi:MAG: hypothetical protein FJX42_06460 [Alphaproteobacteria bacterium]|nr:hypothetical protein [Alphaproteobacteria bacterium]